MRRVDRAAVRRPAIRRVAAPTAATEHAVRGSFGAHSARLKQTFTGDVTAGGNVVVTGDTTRFEGGIMAKGLVTLAPTTLFRDGVAGSFVEFYAPMAQQELPLLPFAAVAKAPNVTVPGGTTLTIGPGKYGTISVQNGATLVLQRGQYVVTKLTMGVGAFMQYEQNAPPHQPVGPLGEMPIQPPETTIMHVKEAMNLSRGAIISSGQAALSTHFKLFYHTKKSPLTFPQVAFFHGTLVAPLARPSISKVGGPHSVGTSLTSDPA